jgi:hypothetical protein
MKGFIVALFIFLCSITSTASSQGCKDAIRILTTQAQNKGQVTQALQSVKISPLEVTLTVESTHSFESTLNSYDSLLASLQKNVETECSK